jgi:hypothetical protein
MPAEGVRPKSVPPPLPDASPPSAAQAPPSPDDVLHEEDIHSSPGDVLAARVVPPPLPIQLSAADDDAPRRDSVVPEDDIIGGRIHVMYDRLAHDDYAGALMVAESLLAREPDHHDARQCRDMCQNELGKLYLSRLGSLSRVPQLSMAPEHAILRVPDPRVDLVLSHVDGLRDLSAVVEASGMSSFEALGLLSELYLRDVIEFEDE